MYKPYNVVMLHANEKAKIGSIMKCIKLSSLHDDRIDKEIGQLTLNKNFNVTQSNDYWQSQHLYITLDDEIKEGDWYLHISNDITGKEYKTLNQCHKPHRKKNDDWFVDGMYSNKCHKIIATIVICSEAVR